MKIKPKSCSCQHCLRGKRTAGGRRSMLADERANRRAVKTKLDEYRGVEYNYIILDELGDLMVPAVHIGNRYD